jgi:hypothetical protein
MRDVESLPPDPFHYDCGDVSTHKVYADGTRWARCKVGSGTEFGPLTKDDAGRWCVTGGYSRAIKGSE